MELTGSRGTANFIKKWDGEQTQSYLKMIDVKKVTGATEITDSDQWVTLFAIECRGLEPVKWMPKEVIHQSCQGRIDILFKEDNLFSNFRNFFAIGF